MNELLFITIAIIFVLTLILFKGDFISPSILMVGFFLICSYLALYASKRLALNLGNETYYVIIMGIVSFVVTSICVHVIYRLRGKNQYAYLKKDFEIIKVKNKNIMLLISAIIFLVGVISIYNVARTLTDGGLSAIIYAYRLNLLNGEERIPSIVANLITFNYAIGYVSIYILLNNWFASKKIDKKLMCTIIFPALTGLASGARGYLVHYIVFGIVIFYYFYLVKNNKRFIDFRLIFKIIIIAFLGIYLIYFLKFILGRQDTLDFFDYISGLLSSPIKLLDLFVKENHANSKQWGLETFTSLISTISRWTGGGIVRYNEYANFRYHNGVSLGNVYTAFRAYYADFGVTGVVVIPSMIGLVSSVMYERFRCQYRASKMIINKYLFIYAYLSYGIAMMFYSNTILEYTADIAFVKIIVFWIIINALFVRGGFRIKKYN